MKTKFDEYLEFPCKFPFKVVGYTDPTLSDKVIAVIQKHVPGDYHPTAKDSGKGTYQSLSIDVTVASKEQVETLYKELADIDIVRMVL